VTLKPDALDQNFLRWLLLIVLTIALVFYISRIADLRLEAFGTMLGAILLAMIANGIAGLHAVAALDWSGCCGHRAAGARGDDRLVVRDRDRQRRRQIGSDAAARLQLIQTKLGASPMGKLLIDSGKAAAGGSPVATLLLGASWGASEILLNLIISLIAAIFFAVDPDLYRRGGLLLVPRF
jgi:hypothetical protein